MPMRGHASSLNLSVAAGILLYSLNPGEAGEKS
jgi:tRNA G18 (ribose-2'-O)-methylase SpoU